METTELRPLSLGELLDRTFTLYRAHFWIFVGIMAVPAAFGIPVNYLALSFEGKMFASVQPGKPPIAPQPALIAAFVIGIAIFWVALVLVYSITVAAVTHAVSEAYLGRRSTVRDSFRSIRGRFWRLMGVVVNLALRFIGICIAVVFVVALVGGGLVAATAAIGNQAAIAAATGLFVLFVYFFALAAIIYLMLRYAVTIPALMLEDLGILAAIRRSVQLTKGRRGHLFVALLLAFIIAYVGLIIFQMPFMIATMVTMLKNHNLPAWLALSSAVSGAIGGSITGPVSMIVIVLCYYDTRIRKEAFDLQFMMASLDRQAPGAGAGPSA